MELGALWFEGARFQEKNGVIPDKAPGVRQSKSIFGTDFSASALRARIFIVVNAAKGASQYPLTPTLSPQEGRGGIPVPSPLWGEG